MDTRAPLLCLDRVALAACALAFFLAFSAQQVQAQFATVRGRVVDQTDAQPLPGAAIVVRSETGEQVGTATDGNGFFVLPRIPPGRYFLAATFVGYAPHADTLDLAFGDQPVLTIAMATSEAALDEVTVEAGPEERTSGAAGLVTVTPAALARVPMPGLSADLVAYLRTLPGIVATGDQGGQLAIRGGTPTQNLVLLDGMPIYQPFHLVGFYSAFPADLVSYADVYAGGFPARYGGRISSAIDVATRNGSKRRVQGAASLAPFLGALRLEGPIVPGKVSLLASVRESVIERIAPDLLGRALPYRFGDRFLKLHAFLTRTSSLALTTLHTFDEGNLAGTDDADARLQWTNQAYGGRFVYLPEDFAALFSMRFFVSQLRSRYAPPEDVRRLAEADEFGGEMGFTYFLGRAELQAAIFGRSQRFDYDLGVAEGQREEFLTEGGFFLDLTADLPADVRLEPGLRFHTFPSRSQAFFEPRLRATWAFGPARRYTFSAAWGVYHQEITGLYNLRDIADVFVAWAPSPENTAVPRARHAIVGWEGRLGRGVRLSVEGYRKNLANMTFARYRLGDGRFVGLETADGTARGTDVRLSWSRRSASATVGYGLASVWYEGADGVRFRPPHDRRHQADVQVHLARGAFTASAHWQIGSGLPFTQGHGFYDRVPLSAPSDAFRTRPGTATLAPAPPYAGRLPAYHRLDLSLERRFAFRHFAATAQAAVINAYNRANLFDYDFFTARRLDQLPLIPSFGVKVEVF